jgi:uncharacterized protein (DUF4213/DUF364 family)
MTTQNLTNTITAFYYTGSTALEHLAIGQAHGVVANGKRKQMPVGTTVLNYARTGDKFYAQVGIATGNAVAGAANTFWATWDNPNSVVFEVVWVTKIVPVPAEMFANQTMSLPLTDAELVALYALRA